MPNRHTQKKLGYLLVLGVWLRIRFPGYQIKHVQKTAKNFLSTKKTDTKKKKWPVFFVGSESENFSSKNSGTANSTHPHVLRAAILSPDGNGGPIRW